jgi:hypothetical protein
MIPWCALDDHARAPLKEALPLVMTMVRRPEAINGGF